VNLTPLLETPFTVTTISPVVVAGTRTVIWVLDHETTSAGTPWKVTTLPPWVSAKPVPLMTTVSPGAPQVGCTSVMDGGSSEGVESGTPPFSQPERAKNAKATIKNHILLMYTPPSKGQKDPGSGQKALSRGSTGLWSDHSSHHVQGSVERIAGLIGHPHDRDVGEEHLNLVTGNLYSPRRRKSKTRPHTQPRKCYNIPRKEGEEEHAKEEHPGALHRYHALCHLRAPSCRVRTPEPRAPGLAHSIP
jgi:hypothetical protein